jgi:hypothetical protein
MRPVQADGANRAVAITTCAAVALVALRVTVASLAVTSVHCRDLADGALFVTERPVHQRAVAFGFFILRRHASGIKAFICTALRILHAVHVLATIRSIGINFFSFGFILVRGIDVRCVANEVATSSVLTIELEGSEEATLGIFVTLDSQASILCGGVLPSLFVIEIRVDRSVVADVGTS